MTSSVMQTKENSQNKDRYYSFFFSFEKKKSKSSELYFL